MSEEKILYACPLCMSTLHKSTGLAIPSFWCEKHGVIDPDMTEEDLNNCFPVLYKIDSLIGMLEDFKDRIVNRVRILTALEQREIDEWRVSYYNIKKVIEREFGHLYTPEEMEGYPEIKRNQYLIYTNTSEDYDLKDSFMYGDEIE